MKFKAELLIFSGIITTLGGFFYNFVTQSFAEVGIQDPNPISIPISFAANPKSRLNF